MSRQLRKNDKYVVETAEQFRSRCMRYGLCPECLARLIDTGDEWEITLICTNGRCNFSHTTFMY